MSKPWKLKTNSSNILLVLITLLNIKEECCEGKTNRSWEYNVVDGDDYRVPDRGPNSAIQVYVGHDKIAQFFFSSTKGSSFPFFYNINKCSENFDFVLCLKLFLLDNINSFKVVVNRLNDEKKDVILFNGLVTFKMKSDVNRKNLVNSNGGSDGYNDNDNDDDDDNYLSLDDEIANKILKIFQNRLLRVNFNSKVKMDITPVLKKDGAQNNICFTYKFLEEPESKSVEGELEEGRKKKKKSRFPMMMLPQLLMLGFLPFTLASLKSMVMNAVMVNMMALNGAVFMLIRDLVFGKRPNSNVQYVNYGYSKDRQNQRKRPVLIIHSSAAFVKQPKVHYSRETIGSYNFHKTNYIENFDASRNDYKHGFGEKNDFKRPNLQGNHHDNGNRSNLSFERLGASGFNNFTAAAFQSATENFPGKSDTQTKIPYTYIKGSLNNGEYNKMNYNIFTEGGYNNREFSQINNNIYTSDGSNNNYKDNLIDYKMYVKDNLINGIDNKINNNIYPNNGLNDRNVHQINNNVYIKDGLLNYKENKMNNNYVTDGLKSHQEYKINNKIYKIDNNNHQNNKINNNIYVKDDLINQKDNKMNNNNNYYVTDSVNNHQENKMKSNNHVKDSLHNHRVNKINNNNYFVDSNNNYFLRQNQRTISLKKNINNHSSYETKPKFIYSSKISSSFPATDGVQENLVRKAKATP